MLTANDKYRLDKAGFMDWEIEYFDQMRDPSGGLQPYAELDGGTWQAVMKRRREWVDAMLRQNWTSEQISKAINRWYENKKSRSPYEWVKMEYQPPRRISNYQEARRKRALKEADALTRMTGVSYRKPRGVSW